MPTGELTLPPGNRRPDLNRRLMMATRKRTRAQDRRYRITAERRIDETRIAEERQYEAWLAATYEPPPF
ncbi:hypothetical protein [Mycobacterium sp.]|uniref:hypothetical protein n=1 Tax=Mycobacterium sp. TaxID=1785 RepID=UPI003C785768